jgi:hypothetical protein
MLVVVMITIIATVVVTKDLSRILFCNTQTRLS